MHADGRYVIEWNNERKEDDTSLLSVPSLVNSFSLVGDTPFIIMTRKKK